MFFIYRSSDSDVELRKDFLQNTQEQDQLIMLKAFLFLTQTVGTNFWWKGDVFPKVIREYTKKCEPDLPF